MPDRLNLTMRYAKGSVPMRIRPWGFLFFVVLVGAAPDEKPAVPVNVELSVLSPDTHSLVNAKVSIKAADAEKPITLSVVTDDHGIARYQVPAGVWAMQISIPGVGYGNIGSMEYVPDQTAKPSLPPLAPYGSISGTVPVELLTPGSKIMASQSYADFEEPITAVPGPGGHFKISNARSGIWWIWAGTDRNTRCADGGREFTLAPGQALEGVQLKPIPKEQNSGPLSVRRAPLPGEDQTVVWVKGTVRDDSGHPIANATVFGLATYYGGIRMYEETSSAKTDSAGGYELKGPGGQSMFSLTILASVSGRPPVWDWPSFPPERGGFIDAAADRKPPPPLAPPTEDLVVSSHGGRLNVTVFRDGKPAPGAFVAAYLENANLRDIWAAGVGPDHDAMEDIAYPIVPADSDGVAHFENLPPGRYGVFASQGDRLITRSLHERPVFRQNIDVPCSISHGIAVGIDQITNLKVAAYPQPNRASFRLLDSNGAPLQDRPAFSYGPVETVQWNSSIELKVSGDGEMIFGSPGLWHIETMYRQVPIQTIPIQEPFFACVDTLAVSPSLVSSYVPTFTSRRFEPPSVHIVVKDSAGKPLQVPVELDRPWGLAIASGSADQNGQIVFTGLVTGFDYTARAFVPQMQPIDLGYGDEPLPIEQLRNRTEILGRSFIAVRDVQSQVILSPEAVAYVRGKIQPPNGTDQKNSRVDVYVDQSVSGSGASARVRTSTGEFVAGPFRPGPVSLTGICRGPDWNESKITTATDVQPGDAKWISLSLPALNTPRSRSPGSMMIGFGGATALTSDAQLLSGRVLLSDGKTPAWGAQVFYFEPGQSGPTVMGIVDVLGNIRPRSLWQDMNAVPPGTILGPPSPTIVALLPGQCGAVIASPAQNRGDAIRLTLPRALSIPGRVTIGKSAPTNRKGSIRIFAEFQDKGALNGVLSVQTTADVDGNFNLAGITPGDYKIQAALDDIWLSPTNSVRITEPNPNPITLDIGSPGGPVIVHMQDREGKPAVGQSITIDRPNGPLTEALWPTHWISDGAGQIYIPTLEAGSNVLKAAHSPDPVIVNVPPLPSTRPVEASITVGH